MSLYDTSNPLQKEQFKARSAKLAESGKVVELTEKKPKRSLQSNKYLHVILGYFACETGNTLEWVKQQYYKKLVNPSIFIRERDDKYLGRIKILRISADLDSAEMSTSITRFRNWASFIDEDTGETVTIERNEILFDRGTLIDQDTLAKIRFSMEADGIKEVEVSNQNRLAFENENKFLYPYLAQAQIGDKKHKFLLYATGLENSCSILKDYIELNYMFGFTLTMVKEFDSCVILTDNLKERKIDDATLEELKDTFLLNDSVTEEDEEEGDSKPNEKKFYQIETKITFTEGENEDERVQTFVVNTFNVDRAMMLITHYLKNKEEECEIQAKEKGHEFRKREIHTAIESAKPIPVGRFIPKEFSMAYME